MRQCKTSAEERALIAKESAAIRSSLKEDESSLRHRNVAKLMYMHMLGYPTHFGQMECVKLIATNGFPEKRVGYLGLMILLDERQEVTMLVTNSIKNDLGHKNHFIVGLALCALGNICTGEMARDVAPEVAGLLSSKNSYVRKKAALCAIRVVKKVPELAESFLDGAENLLSDRHHGVLLAAVTLILQLCVDTRDKTPDSLDPKIVLTRFRKRVPEIIKITRALLHGAYSAEHDVGGQHDPFLQVKLLKLLGVLGANHPETSDAISDTLANVASNITSGKNAGNAILYEAVRTIVSTESVGGLRVLAVNVLGRFLADKDNNVRYVALNALAKVVQHDAQAVQRHRRTIVECVKDSDITIRRSALQLVYSLVNHGNVEVLLKELLEYLKVADVEFKADVAKRVAGLISQFAPDDKWRVDSFIDLLIKGGSYIANDEIRVFLSLLSNRPELQGYAARSLFKAAHDESNSNHFQLLATSAWVLGEFGDKGLDSGTRLSDEPTLVLSELDIINTLTILVLDTHTPGPVKGVATTALTKLAARFPRQAGICRQSIQTSVGSLNLELQQRAVEFCSVFDKGPQFTGTLLERMPLMKIRDEVGGVTGGAGAKVNAGNAAKATSASTSDADLLGDLLGGDVGGGVGPSTSSGADLLGDLLGGGIGGGSQFPNSNADPLSGLMGGASVGGFAATLQAQTSVDPMADLMGGLSMGNTGVGAASAFSASPSTDPMADLLGGVSNVADPMSGLSQDPMAAVVSPATIVPALNANGVSVTFSCVKPNSSDPSATTITATYANDTPQTLTGFTCRAAVPKTMSLALEPASASDISPNSKATQILNVVNAMYSAKPLAMRLQMTWKEGAHERTETATVSFPQGF